MMMMMMVTSQQAKHYEYAKEPNPPNPPSQYQHSINCEFRGIEANLVPLKITLWISSTFWGTIPFFASPTWSLVLFWKDSDICQLQTWSHDQAFEGNTGFITRYNQPLDPIKWAPRWSEKHQLPSKMIGFLREHSGIVWPWACLHQNRLAKQSIVEDFSKCRRQHAEGHFH